MFIERGNKNPSFSNNKREKIQHVTGNEMQFLQNQVYHGSLFLGVQKNHFSLPFLCTGSIFFSLVSNIVISCSEISRKIFLSSQPEKSKNPVTRPYFSFYVPFILTASSSLINTINFPFFSRMFQMHKKKWLSINFFIHQIRVIQMCAPCGLFLSLSGTLPDVSADSSSACFFARLLFFFRIWRHKTGNTLEKKTKDDHHRGSP